MPKFVTANLSNNAEPCILRYTTSDNEMLYIKADRFDAEIISHIYNNGEGQVIFNKPIMRIGRYAFSLCSSLTSVTIPDSVTEIGEGAFCVCSGLNTFYGKFASADNRCLIIDGVLNSFAPTGLTKYVIPDSVTKIGKWAFSKCSGLTSVTIPNSVTEIGERAFYECSGLTSVTIPDSVTEIGECAFDGCSGLTSVTIPNSVTKIGNFAFSGCSSLTSVIIPNSVTEIGECAFYECSSLTSVTIGNSVTKIGFRAFYGCSGLTSITIGNSVIEIGYEAFSGCSGVQTIICKATTPPRLDRFAFIGIPSDVTIIIPEGCEEAYTNSVWGKVL